MRTGHLFADIYSDDVFIVVLLSGYKSMVIRFRLQGPTKTSKRYGRIHQVDYKDCCVTDSGNILFSGLSVLLCTFEM